MIDDVGEGRRIWPSQRIREAVSRGEVGAPSPVMLGQIQPASIDHRLGLRGWRTGASFLPGAGRTVESMLAELGARTFDMTQPTVLERGSVHVIELLETLALPEGVSVRCNPKSTTGRLDVLVRVITDDGERYDEVPEGYVGKLYAEVVPRAFAVVAQVGDCLGQLRFRERAAPWGRREQLLSVDLSPCEGHDGACGYRARKTSGVVDLRRVGGHRRTDFWDPVVVDPGRGMTILDVDDLYILRSLEDVSADAMEAAELVASDASLMAGDWHSAGFLDPNFGNVEGGAAPSRMVYETRCRGVPFVLKHGQVVATLKFERMLERPDVLYGAAGSNYQGQSLRLAKQFD